MQCYQIYFGGKNSIIIIGMKCCEGGGQEHQITRNKLKASEGGQDPQLNRSKFKASEQQQPLKFRLLSFLGLKEYLIDKYVFSRPEPKYQITHSNGSLMLKTETQIDIPSQYEQEIRHIQDQAHSVYAVSLNLRNRRAYAGTVIYSHGNSSDISHSLAFISRFAAQFPKFDYMVYDYTGYGKSAGKQNITQESICEDLELLIGNIVAPPQQIILWGFSLGCYPTAKVATKVNVKGVVLQSPLASIYSLFVENLSPYSTFTNDCFSILDNIGNINCFLLLVHSRGDEIIPIKHSQVLYERHRMISSNPYCFLLEVTALKHNHMHAFLGDAASNKVRDNFHSYLDLMIEHQRLPKGRQLQLQKEIYLNDIPKYEQIERINIESREIKDAQSEKAIEVRSEVNFTAVKRQVDFELDEVTEEQKIEKSCFMGEVCTRHRGYFKVSKEAIDQTEASEILPEKRAYTLLE